MIEFFYDLSSPWTRLAFHNIQPVVRELDVPITLRPILVGGVFNAVNDSVYKLRENVDDRKWRHAWIWLKEWALIAGVEMNFPSQHHPVKSVHAMRFCCALEDDQEALRHFSELAFDAYFGDQRNLDDPAVLVDVANVANLDGVKLQARSTTDKIKAKLRANTQELIDRGGYGSPTIFVAQSHMFFGNDQLPIFRNVVQRLLAEPRELQDGSL